VTGYAREEDRLHALKSGFDAHVRKPIDIEKLERLLQNVQSTHAT